jgi:hypothetical protein
MSSYKKKVHEYKKSIEISKAKLPALNTAFGTDEHMAHLMHATLTETKTPKIASQRK